MRKKKSDKVVLFFIYALDYLYALGHLLSFVSVWLSFFKVFYLAKDKMLDLCGKFVKDVK